MWKQGKVIIKKINYQLTNSSKTGTTPVSH